MSDEPDDAPDEHVLVLSSAECDRLLEQIDEVPQVNPQLLKALRRTKRRRRHW